MVQPLALVISDFPIVGRAVREVFGPRFDVCHVTWTAFVEQPGQPAELVIVDVTTTAADAALGLMARVYPEARVVVCSLHRNEVEVYRVEHSTYRAESALPNLLALAA